VDVFVAARNAEVPLLRRCRDDLPEELYQILDRAMAREPADRYQSAEEMLRAMTTLLRSQPESTDAFSLSRSVIEARRAIGLPATSTAPHPPVKPPAESPPQPAAEQAGGGQPDGVA
jgi:serine/threonine-protein kinase